jgi:hypothetical protein
MHQEQVHDSRIARTEMAERQQQAGLRRNYFAELARTKKIEPLYLENVNGKIFTQATQEDPTKLTADQVIQCKRQITLAQNAIATNGYHAESYANLCRALGPAECYDNWRRFAQASKETQAQWLKLMLELEIIELIENILLDFCRQNSFKETLSFTEWESPETGLKNLLKTELTHLATDIMYAPPVLWQIDSALLTMARKYRATLIQNKLDDFDRYPMQKIEIAFFSLHTKRESLVTELRQCTEKQKGINQKGADDKALLTSIWDQFAAQYRLEEQEAAALKASGIAYAATHPELNIHVNYSAQSLLDYALKQDPPNPQSIEYLMKHGYLLKDPPQQLKRQTLPEWISLVAKHAPYNSFLAPLLCSILLHYEQKIKKLARLYDLPMIGRMLGWLLGSEEQQFLKVQLLTFALMSSEQAPTAATELKLLDAYLATDEHIGRPIFCPKIEYPIATRTIYELYHSEVLAHQRRLQSPVATIEESPTHSDSNQPQIGSLFV